MMIEMHCPRCGSKDLLIDATARWNTAAQAWELAGTQDAITCEKCGAENYESSCAVDVVTTP
jgi:hypothetical protein